MFHLVGRQWVHWLGHIFEAPLEEFCGNVMMGSASPSIVHIDPICSKSFYSTPISFALVATTPSYVHAFHEFLGDISGSLPSFNSYYAYLVDGPRKIMWNIFFDLVFYFSMTFD